MTQWEQQWQNQMDLFDFKIRDLETLLRNNGYYIVSKFMPLSLEDRVKYTESLKKFQEYYNNLEISGPYA